MSEVSRIEAEAFAAARAGISHLIHRDPVGDVQAALGTAPRPSFTPAATSPSPQPEEPHMSARLADAEKAVEALASHIKAFASNPLVDTLIEVGAGIFLTPAEVVAVKAFVQALEADRAPATATAAAAQGVATAFQGGSGTQAAQAAAVPVIQ